MKNEPRKPWKPRDAESHHIIDNIFVYCQNPIKIFVLVLALLQDIE